MHSRQSTRLTEAHRCASLELLCNVHLNEFVPVPSISITQHTQIWCTQGKPTRKWCTRPQSYKLRYVRKRLSIGSTSNRLHGSSIAPSTSNFVNVPGVRNGGIGQKTHAACASSSSIVSPPLQKQSSPVGLLSAGCHRLEPQEKPRRIIKHVGAA